MNVDIDIRKDYYFSKNIPDEVFELINTKEYKVVLALITGASPNIMFILIKNKTEVLDVDGEWYPIEYMFPLIVENGREVLISWVEDHIAKESVDKYCLCLSNTEFTDLLLHGMESKVVDTIEKWASTIEDSDNIEYGWHGHYVCFLDNVRFDWT